MEKLHAISKGASEEYSVFFTGLDDAPIKVYNVKTGFLEDVLYGQIHENGVFEEKPEVKTYFQGITDAQKEIECITIHDNTFVVNKNKKPQLTDDKTPEVDYQELFIVVDRWYEKSLEITVGEKTITASPADGYNATIDDVAELIKDKLLNTDWANEISFDYTGDYDGTWQTSDSSVDNFYIHVSSDGAITGNIDNGWHVGGDVDSSGNVNMMSIDAPETYEFTGTIDSNYDISGNWETQSGGADGTWSGTRVSTYEPGETFTVERKGAVLRLVYSGDSLGTDLSLHEGFVKITGRGISVRAGSVPTFQDLWPASYWPDVKMQVQQGSQSQVEGYYVYSDGSKWIEAPGYKVNTSFDPDTMPHKIVRWSNGSFKVSPCLWEDRLIGDEKSAPMPSFIDKQINSLFFHQDRLSFITEQSIIMSKTGDYFNFFPSTALEILDDDPIDISVGNVKSSPLQEALPFNKQIILRGLSSQHLLSYSGSYLSPLNAALDVTTVYRTFPQSISGGVGNNLYFLTPVKGYAQVMEYFIQPDTYLEDAAVISKQAPEYIKADTDKPCKITPCSEKDMLFVFTNLGDTSVFYTYNYLWQGNQKPVSAWNKWRISDGIIKDAEVVQTNLYLLINAQGRNRFLKIDLDYTGLNYFDLPFKQDYISSRVYLSYIPDDSLELYLMKSSGEFKKVQNFTVSGKIVDIEDDLEDYEYIIGGLKNPAFIQLSPWYIRDKNDQPVMNNLHLKRLMVSLEPTNGYQVNNTTRKPHESSSEETIDTLHVLKRDAHNMDVTISSEGGFPLNLKTVTYEGSTYSKPKILR